MKTRAYNLIADKPPRPGQQVFAHGPKMPEPVFGYWEAKAGKVFTANGYVEATHFIPVPAHPFA